MKTNTDTYDFVQNLVMVFALTRRILQELRRSIPDLTPFEIKKRVVLQEAYDKGRSIFSFEAPTSNKADDCHELRRLYTQLAEFITARTGKGASAA